MNRTRAALMNGARTAVATSGTRLSMAQIATAAGVAKATLYNHFRTRDAVLRALLADEVSTLVNEVVGLAAEPALRHAAISIGSNPLRAALAAIEPATLARLAATSSTETLDSQVDGSPWYLVRQAIQVVLAPAAETSNGMSAVPVTPAEPLTETLVRWLSSFLLAPGTDDQIAYDVSILLTTPRDRPLAVPPADVTT